MNSQDIYHHDFINCTLETDRDNNTNLCIQVHKPKKYDVTKEGEYHSITLYIDSMQFEDLVWAWHEKKKLRLMRDMVPK